VEEERLNQEKAAKIKVSLSSLLILHRDVTVITDQAVVAPKRAELNPCLALLSIRAEAEGR
jgi:hypothetical protein